MSEQKLFYQGQDVSTLSKEQLIEALWVAKKEIENYRNLYNDQLKNQLIIKPHNS